MEIDAIVNERYTVLELTAAITNRQNEYGLLNSLGLFAEKGIAERFVKIERREQTLHIIPTSPVGTPAPADDDPDPANIRILPTFRHAKKHSLLAEDLQGVRKFGTEDQLEVFDEKVMEKLDKIQREHRQTKEFLRWGALKGNVYDADGVKVLYNVYTEMGEVQKVIDWALGDAASVDAIADGNMALHDYLEDEALGEPISGVVMFCSEGYHNALMKNKDFREAYRYFESRGGPNPNRELLRGPFTFKDVTYFRHRGKCSFKKSDGSIVTHQFIPTNEAIAVPLGTYETFESFFGPGEFMEAVNTIGQEIYVKPDVMKLNMGVELHSFSYPLHLVKKPRLVVRCTFSNGV
ncbi:MAG: major capsid protein [Hyphomicrobium sp.]